MTAKEIELGFQEVWKLFMEVREDFKKTDNEIKELANRFKETDNEIKELADRFKETDNGIKELSKTVDKLSKEVEKTTKAVDGLSSKWSRFVEGLIVPAMERLFKERGIKIDKILTRVRAKGRVMEIDILAINGKYAILVEVKSTLKVNDVKEHIERLKDFKVAFPEYNDKHVVGAVAGIVIDEKADRYAYRKGLFVIAESGNTVDILNDGKFVPKMW